MQTKVNFPVFLGGILSGKALSQGFIFISTCMFKEKVRKIILKEYYIVRMYGDFI